VTEADFIALMREVAGTEAARGLYDDAAVFDVGGKLLVATHDMLVEGVHYRASDAPADVAWKLAAVNLSDLAAMGARPLGALVGYCLGEDAWDRAFAKGLGEALAHFGLPLLGGDTVASSTRILGLTAFGIAERAPPGRGGARPGDMLGVTGTIGDAGAGLEAPADSSLARRYLRPEPRIAAGAMLAASASAMMDVSDGLLIDAARMAEASGVSIAIALEKIPLSLAFIQARGETLEARLFAATAGDDYELLFASEAADTPIGTVDDGAGLRLTFEGRPVPLPERLGWEHRGG